MVGDMCTDPLASACASWEAWPQALEEALQEPNRVFVHMRPSQCVNILTALSTVVSQVTRSVPVTAKTQQLFHQYDVSDLMLIPALFNAVNYEMPSIVLVVHELETFSVAVLNDALQALLAWSAGALGKAPMIHFLFTYTVPLPVLPRARAYESSAHAKPWIHSFLTPRVLAQMDLATIDLPDKTEFWEQVVCAFFALPRTNIWLGRSIFELVRRRYWHISPSYETVAQCIRLCYLEHFRSRPLSAFVNRRPDLASIQEHWSEEILAQMRLALCSSYFDHDHIPQRVKKLAKDDSALLSTVSGVCQDMELCMTRRAIALTVVDVLLRTMGIAGAVGTKLGLSGCTAVTLEWDPPFTDWDASRTSVTGVTSSTPQAEQLGTLIQHLCTTVTAEQVDSLMTILLESLQSLEATLDVAAAAVVRSSYRDLKTVLEKPAKQNSAETVSARRLALARWVSTTWAEHHETPSDLGAAICTYDFADPISTLLEGAARANILFALDTPTEALVSMYAASQTASGQREQSLKHDWPEWEAKTSDVHTLRAMHVALETCVVPDVCRLYSLYKESSKFINLADWYEAFVQSFETDAKQREQKELPTEEEAASLQMRFSLAVNELAHMGLLGPTGRKPEHVYRIVWDLPIGSMDDA